MANGGDVIFNFKGEDKGLNKTIKSATSTLKGIGSTILKTAGIGTLSFSTMFGTAVAGSIKARGEIEQSIGGIETLFKKSANKVVNNAQKAYKTAGISANQYMEQATSFSASLLQGLKGDTEKATDIADMAIIDMADNANKMGTSIEMIQNAYQGFAKQNYTMLDNLKLGYGGTKSEMVRLVKESGILGKASEDLTLKNFDEKVSFDQIIQAIHKVQENMDITGTTSKEASETLQGSVASFKASWHNLLSGMGTTKELIESFKPLIKNIGRIAKEAIKGIWEAVKELIAKALEPVKKWMDEHKNELIIIIGVIGTLAGAILAYLIAQNLATIALGIYNGVMALATAATGAFTAVLGFLTSPITLVVLAIGALITIGVLLARNWETVKEKAIEIWGKIKEFLGNVINGIIEWFKELPYKIGYFIGEIVGKVIQFGTNIGNWITNDLPKIINGIVEWFKSLPSKIWNALLNALKSFGRWFAEMFVKAKDGCQKVRDNIVNGFKELPKNLLNIGKNIVEGLWNGIKNAGSWIINKVKNFAKGILDGMKSALGIHSPSALFRDEVGIYMAQGIGEGFTDEMGAVSKQMNKALATVGLGDMFELSPTLNRTTTSSSNVNIKVINNMETDFMGNLVNNIRTYSNGSKNDYNYGMAY